MNLRRIILLIFQCIVSDSFVLQNQIYFIFYVYFIAAMLSAARINRNKYLSQKVFDRMNLLFPNVESCLLPATVLLSNTYSAVGDFSKASQVRMGIDRMSLKKKIGLTWTVVNEKVVVSQRASQKNVYSD